MEYLSKKGKTPNNPKAPLFGGFLGLGFLLPTLATMDLMTVKDEAIEYRRGDPELKVFAFEYAPGMLTINQG